MIELSKITMSMNESYHICTHDMSGHLHLLKFCMDEIISNKEFSSNKYIKKMNIAIGALQVSNEKWKQSTLGLDKNGGIDFESLLLKSKAIYSLYAKEKFLKINFKGALEGYDLGDNAIVLCEALFSAFSILSEIAIKTNTENITIVLSQKEEKIIRILCQDLDFNEDLYNEILNEEYEDRRGLRRRTGVQMCNEIGSFRYIDLDLKSCIEVKI